MGRPKRRARRPRKAFKLIRSSNANIEGVPKMKRTILTGILALAPAVAGAMAQQGQPAPAGQTAPAAQPGQSAQPAPAAPAGPRAKSQEELTALKALVAAQRSEEHTSE